MHARGRVSPTASEHCGITGGTPDWACWVRPGEQRGGVALAESHFQGVPCVVRADLQRGRIQEFVKSRGCFGASRRQALAEPVAPELGARTKRPERRFGSINPRIPSATFLASLLPRRTLRATQETERLRRSVALPWKKPCLVAVGWPPRPSRVARSGTPERGETAQPGRLLRSTAVGLRDGQGAHPT